MTRKLSVTVSAVPSHFRGSVLLKKSMIASANCRKSGQHRLCVTYRCMTRHNRSIGFKWGGGGYQHITLVSWCYRDCSPSVRDCRPVRKIPCFHRHGNSRRCRPHFAPSVPSPGRMSLSTVNRGTGSGFQPSFNIRKADLHVSVHDTQSSKRHKYGILIGGGGGGRKCSRMRQSGRAGNGSAFGRGDGGHCPGTHGSPDGAGSPVPAFREAEGSYRRWFSRPRLSWPSSSPGRTPHGDSMA